MPKTTFKEFLIELSKSKGNCDFIKDPKLRKECKKLYKKSPQVRIYGGGFGTSAGAPAGGAAGGGA